MKWWRRFRQRLADILKPKTPGVSVLTVEFAMAESFLHDTDVPSESIAKLMSRNIEPILTAAVEAERAAH